MNVFLSYLQLEVKRTIKSLPHFLTGAIVLVLLAGTIAFSASKLLYGEQKLDRMEVGVIIPDEDRLAKTAIKMVASLDSVGSLCDFTYVKETEGRRLLQEGTLLALLKLPEGLVEGIMNGSNPPVTVYFSDHAGLSAAVFRELTEAGSSILGTAQAGIYAADDYLRAKGEGNSISLAEADLNRLFLAASLSRERYFKTERVSATGAVSVAEFYGISASVLILLLLGIPAAPIVRPYQRVMEEKLTLLGIGRIKRTLVRTLCLLLLLLLFSGAPFLLCLRLGLFASGGVSIVLWLLSCLAASGLILFIYELCQNTAAAILLLFFSAIVMVFLSGGLIPSVFLPETVQSVGAWMPTTLLFDGVRFMITGEGVAVIGRLLLFEGCLFVLSAAVRRNNE